jgi:ATP-dependent exoDNAse (exonuclease V) beta subunit
MTQHFNHVQMLASAGSGKTYQLSNRYLGLVYAGVEPASLLASTFTRVAAGEIRDRILERAACAVLDADARSALGAAISAPSFDEAAAIALLDRLLDALPSMQIRTLDGFFTTLVRTHALDLDLPPVLDFLDDVATEELRHEAIRLLLDETDPQRMISLLRALTQGQTTRSVTQTIDSTISELKSMYADSSPDAWRVPPPATPGLDARRVPIAVATLAGLGSDDVGRIEAHVQHAIDLIQSGDWDGFAKSRLVEIFITGTFSRKPLSAALIEAVTPLVNHAMVILRARWNDEGEAAYGILAEYVARERELKQRRAALTFEDLPVMTAALMDTYGVRPVLRRAGMDIHHVLLDEFQDTSIEQWRAIRPLLQHMIEPVREMAEARSLFCVGDVKQSIYAWREGCPDLLEQLDTLLDVPPGVTIERLPLARSYRSSRVVMDFVNTVFGTIGENAALREHEKAADWWAAQFVPHDTALSIPGYVKVETCISGGQQWKRLRKEDCLQRTVALVEELHREHPHATIGILTRRNALVTELMYRLGPDGSGLPVAGRGGRPVIDAAPVNAMLDALRLIDHPDDTIAAFNVANSPLGEHLGFTSFSDRESRRGTADVLRRRVMSDGLTPLLAGWLHALAGHMAAWDQRRCEQLVELALTFDGRRVMRVDEFITYVEGTRVPLPGDAPIQAMSIHQSKGLEFDIVILPELDFRLASERAPRMVRTRSGVAGEIDRVQRWPHRVYRPLMQDLEGPWAAETFKRVRESLCMLYVAITRARRGLFCFMHPVSKSLKSLEDVSEHASGVLGWALAQMPEELQEDMNVFEAGDRSTFMDDTAPTEARTPAASDCDDDDVDRDGDRDGDDAHPSREDLARRPIVLRASPDRFRGVMASPSEDAHASRSIRHLMSMPNERALDHGTAIHALFECIEWSDDPWPPADVLHRAVRRAVRGHDAAWIESELASFMSMFEHEGVREAMVRGGRSARVEREQPFARLVRGGVQRGIIDRLDITLDAAGRPERARVIDFKTDPAEGKKLTLRSVDYARQLEAYREVAADLTGLDRSAVGATLLFVTTGRVLEVGSSA